MEQREVQTVTDIGWLEGKVKGRKQMSGPKKRFTAAMNPDYMFTVIFGK